MCALASVAHAQGTRVHVSSRDRAEIRAAVRAITREPILNIDPITERHPVPGAMPVKEYELGPFKNGKVTMKPVIAYERTDRVSVRTGSDANLTGKVYTVQKAATGWKVIADSTWIH
jgi:hypothetical protein